MQGEFSVYNDAGLNGVIGSSMHYFSTATGVEINGNDRFGMIFPTSTAAGDNVFHLIISSGSVSGLADKVS